MSELIPVHVGLMGHIDHGKTELARVLSEKISTAGLDKHPQSKKRGITIDLGFTMFRLNEYLVTLVDAPGHADLIRSVVAGANIIDAAVLVVAADEGPMVQTGEHIVVLKSLGVKSLVVALTKIDLVDESRISDMKSKTQKILQSAGFQDAEIIPVSATIGSGIDELRNALFNVISPQPRDTTSSFLMPLDHAFPIKGHGTIVTGTVLRGTIDLGDSLQLIPLDSLVKVRTIQVFGEDKEQAVAGDRIGINIPEISERDIRRGDYLSTPNSFHSANALICQIEMNPLYRGTITERMNISSLIGMSDVTSEAFPIEPFSTSYVIVDNPSSSTFQLALLLQRPIGIEQGMSILLMRTDLPPTSMRIIGSGQVTEIHPHLNLYRKHIRKGKVSRIREYDVLVEGLAHSKSSAEKLEDSPVKTESDVVGRLKQTFGTKGVLTAVFEQPIVESEVVIYERLIMEEIEFGH
ncbi:MAG: selenocysteine-specific translation elongation factor [Candidatus Thorarchaeota archaeon]